MRKKSLKLLLTAFTAYVAMGLGFSQTTIDAEFRPRTEVRQGFRKPLADTLVPAFATFQRTRINADYKGKQLNARVSLQDARIWGNSDNKTSSSKLEIYEAWFEYLINSDLSLQMGRQPLKYDDQRLFGVSNWSNTGTAHDIALLKYKKAPVQLHSGFAYNNSKDTLMDIAYSYSPRQNYKTMFFVWASKQFTKGLGVTAIGVYEGFQKKTDYRIVYPRLTYGGNLVYANDSSAWGYSATVYLQNGRDPGKMYGATYAKLNSHFLSAKISYKFAPKLVANVGMDHYSGSATDIDASKSTSFNRLYGTAHSFNGFMEYFVALPAQGLTNYYGGVTSKVSPKLSVDLTGHLFYFDEDFYYNQQKVEKNLGTELDLTLNYALSKEVMVQCGYSRFFNSSSTSKYYKMYGVSTNQQWAYIMLTVKPVFYKTPQPAANN